MKESNVEGVANHDGPESCAGSREGVGEALTGGRAGWVPSREIKPLGCRRGSGPGRQHGVVRHREHGRRPCAVQDPMHVRELSVRENREILRLLASMVGRDAPGRQSRSRR